MVPTGLDDEQYFPAMEVKEISVGANTILVDVRGLNYNLYHAHKAKVIPKLHLVWQNIYPSSSSGHDLYHNRPQLCVHARIRQGHRK